MAQNEIMAFVPFCKQFIEEHIDKYEGQSHCGYDIAGCLTEEMNVNGSFTYSREKAKDYIKEWWDDAAEYSDYEEMNWGKRESNPFSDPEVFTVRMVIEGVFGIMAQLPIIDKNWNDKIELTPRKIRTIKKQLKELGDDIKVF